MFDFEKAIKECKNFPELETRHNNCDFTDEGSDGIILWINESSFSLNEAKELLEFLKSVLE